MQLVSFFHSPPRLFLTYKDTAYLKARDYATVLNTSHLSTENYTTATPESVLFSGNNSCILSPEVTQGPYCKFNRKTVKRLLIRHYADVSGEYIRDNVTENQAGVGLILDAQVIDMVSCDPITTAMIEIWRTSSFQLIYPYPANLSC